jgi:hypothetical protein
MRRLARHRPTPAMIVALIALFVALSGASYAALAVNSVGPKQLRKNAVRSPKVKDRSLKGIDLGEKTVTGTEVADASLSGIDIADGSVGLADLGANSVNGSKVVNGSLEGADVKAGTFLGGAVSVQFAQAAADLAAGASVSVDVFCLPGEVALGGGARGDLTDSEATSVGSSRPIISEAERGAPVSGGTFTGWRTTVLHKEGSAATGIRPEVWVICAKVA